MKILKYFLIVIAVLVILVPLVSAGTFSVTYNFVDNVTNKAYNYTHSTALNRWAVGTELPAQGYTNIISIDNANATITAPNNNDYLMFRFVFKINQTSSTINNLNITFDGGETCSGTVTAFVFNWTGNSWTTIANVPAIKGTITLNLTSINVANHIGSSNKNITILIDNPVLNDCDTGNQIRADYIKVDATYTDVNPKWSSNTSNSTKTGAYILHSVNWTDDYGLSGYIFSFDNGSGTFANDSFTTFTGTANWSNVSKWVNTTTSSTIRWWVWANDSNNQVNSTNIFSYIVTADTCTYGESGNWALKCSDYCNFSSSQIIPSSNNITITGTGILNFYSGGKWTFTGTNQYININSGCTLNIFPGGGWNY